MSISLTCTLTALISKQAVDYWNMDTASEFHLIMCWKKEKSCICLFFAETRDEERLKTPFPDNSEKSERTSWQDLTKPIAERENFKQNQNLQTMKEGCKHITSGSVSLPARLSVCLHTWLCVNLSDFSLYMFYQKKKCHLSCTTAAAAVTAASSYSHVANYSSAVMLSLKTCFSFSCSTPPKKRCSSHISIAYYTIKQEYL